MHVEVRDERQNPPNHHCQSPTSDRDCAWLRGKDSESVTCEPHPTTLASHCVVDCVHAPGDQPPTQIVLASESVIEHVVLGIHSVMESVHASMVFSSMPCSIDHVSQVTGHVYSVIDVDSEVVDHVACVVDYGLCVIDCVSGAASTTHFAEA